MSAKKSLTIPPAAELQRQLDLLNAERKELARLIRMARAAEHANAARTERSRKAGSR